MAERPQGCSWSSWSSTAAHASRYVSRQLSDDKTPSAESLAGWLASSLVMREGRTWRKIKGLVLGYGGDSDEVGPLRPVFVQHDRSRPKSRVLTRNVMPAVPVVIPVHIMLGVVSVRSGGVSSQHKDFHRVRELQCTLRHAERLALKQLVTSIAKWRGTCGNAS